MKISITLEQHTPIIHFQHNQKGATLRATEIKPKLDRYIKKIFSPTKEKSKYYDKELIEKVENLSKRNGKLSEEDAKYRMTVSNPENKKEITLKRNGAYKSGNRNRKSLYFGDKDKVSDKVMVMYEDDITLHFQSFNKRIIAKIILALPVMLALENFGSRQNKGFGSFSICETDYDDWPEDLQNIAGNAQGIDDIYKEYENGVYAFDAGNDENDYEDVFEKIFYFYNSLKAGINESYRDKVYSKSLLWKHLCQKGVIWEKRTLKMHINGDKLPTILPDNEYRFIRPFLGLSPIYEFKKTEVSKPARMDIDYGDERYIDINKTIKFDVNSDEIKRVTSPITFKPIRYDKDYTVYVILKPELIEGIEGQKFKLSGGSFSKDMKVPDSFNLEKFMDYAVGKMNSGTVNKYVNKLNIEKIQGDCRV